MRLNVFDRQPDALELWQQTAPSLGLVFHHLPSIQPLPEPVRSEVGILIIEHSTLAGEGGPSIAQLCQACPKQRVIVTGLLGVNNVVDAMQSGAASVIEKPLNRDHLVRTVTPVIQQAAAIQQKEAEHNHLNQLFANLSQREHHVLDLVLRGVPNRESAQQLSVSVRTIEARRAKVYEKLECKNLAELVRKIERLEQLKQMFDVSPSKGSVRMSAITGRLYCNVNSSISCHTSGFSLDGLLVNK
jgi:FixJ family two-component response regulator